MYSFFYVSYDKKKWEYQRWELEQKIPTLAVYSPLDTKKCVLCNMGIEPNSGLVELKNDIFGGEI